MAGGKAFVSCMKLRCCEAGGRGLTIGALLPSGWVQVVATNGTIALVAAGATVHGTRPLRVVAVEEGGHVAPGVRRLGFSHFVKCVVFGGGLVG